MDSRKIEKVAALWLSLILVAVSLLARFIDWYDVGVYAGCPWWHHVTYPFFHANVLHAALNCWCLLSVVFLYEVRWPRLLAMLAVAMCVPLDALASAYPSLLRPTVGLSGMIYALFGSLSFDVSRKWYYQRCMLLYISIGFFLPNSNAIIHACCYAAGMALAGFNKLIVHYDKRDKRHIKGK